MQDRFLLELYRTIFRIKEFDITGVLEEYELMEHLGSDTPDLIVIEKNLTPPVCDELVRFVNQKKIPILVLTKPEEACIIEKSVDPGLYGYGDILNENIGDIVKRGEKLAEKWDKNA